MTTTIAGERVGCRIEYPLGQPARFARAHELAETMILKRHIKAGHIYLAHRIRTETAPCDPPHAREDETWEQRTYSYRPTILDRALAPAVKRARWAISLQLARWAYDTRLHARAKANPEGLPGKFHDLVVRTRRSPNVLDDGELYAVLKVPVFEYVRGDHR